MSGRTAELTVLCEGPTEAGFANRVLRPHLCAFGVHIQRAIPLNRANFGTMPFDRIRDAVKADMGRLRAHQFITSMIDLYALRGFPRQDERAANPLAKVRNIEQGMAELLRSPQWIPYIQLHEFEALLYTDLDQLRASFPDEDLTGGIANLKQEVASLGPEDINEGNDTAPSKRLLRWIPGYQKATVGPDVAARITVKRLRENCPHFGEWLSRLERLGGPR